MIDEHLLVTVNEHSAIPKVLLVLTDSDDAALHPMLKHREFKLRHR